MTSGSGKPVAGFNEREAQFHIQPKSETVQLAAVHSRNLLDKFTYDDVEKGIPAALVRQIEGADLTRDEIRLVIADRTLDRRIAKNEALKPDEADGIARLLRIKQLAFDLFENSENSNLWLHLPNPALAGKIPVRMARSDIGAREVETILGRMAYGIFS